MKKLMSNSSGFITMIVLVLAILAIILYLAYTRVAATGN